MERLDHNLDYKWHRAINDFNEDRKPRASWMYDAKAAADEVPRMAMLFEMERNGKLAKRHHQCSHDADGQTVEDNHLTCCMGTECRQCPFLLALEATQATPEQIDTIKAWTCATHILTEYGKNPSFDKSEGWLVTEDDKIYWSNLYASLASMTSDGDEPEGDAEISPDQASLF